MSEENTYFQYSTTKSQQGYIGSRYGGYNNDDDDNNITRGDVRNITNVEILWEGNPISSVKNFQKS